MSQKFLCFIFILPEKIEHRNLVLFFLLISMCSFLHSFWSNLVRIVFEKFTQVVFMATGNE